MSLKEPLHVPCYHCGEPCEGSNIALEDKIFCCEGCKMVYEILNEHDLCRYYQIDDNAGISLKGRSQEHYAYLDDPDIREKLIDYSNGERSNVRFYLPQIHCASCIWLLENMYRLNDSTPVRLCEHRARHSGPLFQRMGLYPFGGTEPAARAF
ncbi:MAG: heavy metal translocating P-type ATPase metal-binding domain-containing protein [Saprospirales bacterium]|nr:heavy metal translocating P-type ATPase metal-binding domain-containing protein [Saprospirales bacterium]